MEKYRCSLNERAEKLCWTIYTVFILVKKNKSRQLSWCRENCSWNQRNYRDWEKTFPQSIQSRRQKTNDFSIVSYQMLLFEFVLRFRNEVEERREIIKCYTLHDHIEIVIVVQMLLKNMSKHSQHDRAERKTPCSKTTSW